MPAQAKAQRGDERGTVWRNYLVHRGQRAVEEVGRDKKGQTVRRVDNMCSVRFVSKALGSHRRSQNKGEVCSRGKIIFTVYKGNRERLEVKGSAGTGYPLRREERS